MALRLRGQQRCQEGLGAAEHCPPLPANTEGAPRPPPNPKCSWCPPVPSSPQKTHSSSPSARMDPVSLQCHSGMHRVVTWHAHKRGQTQCPPQRSQTHQEGVRPPAHHSSSPRAPPVAWGKEGVHRKRARWDREGERKDLPLVASAARGREKRAVRREQRGDPGQAERGGTMMALWHQGHVGTHLGGWAMSQHVPSA